MLLHKVQWCVGGSKNKKGHMSKRINYQEPGPSELPDEMDDIVEMDDNDMGPFSPDEMDVDNNETDVNAIELPERHIFLTKRLSINSAKSLKKGKISGRVLENLLPDHSSEGSDNDDDFDDSEDSEDEDFENDEYEEVNFVSPDFEDDEPKLPSININHAYAWIILWILQYQQRYKLSNVAIDSLFKFLSFFLLTIDKNKFSSFPSSLYMAKKDLGIITEIFQYSACNKCHKLYDINEILKNTEIPTCSFKNYPNHPMERLRQKCNNPLIKKIDSNNEQIFRPIMTYPLVNIKQQLTLFFGRKDFEMSCRKWAERNNETEALFDIYDGMVWKEFKDDNDELFFYKGASRYSSRIDDKYGLVPTLHKFTIFCWCNLCRYL